MTGGAEFLAGFFEGAGLDGEDDAAVVAADEVEAGFLLDELELGGQVRCVPALRNRRRPIRAKRREISRCASRPVHRK